MMFSRAYAWFGGGPVAHHLSACAQLFLGNRSLSNNQADANFGLKECTPYKVGAVVLRIGWGAFWSADTLIEGQGREAYRPASGRLKTTTPYW